MPVEGVDFDKCNEGKMCLHVYIFKDTRGVPQFLNSQKLPGYTSTLPGYF